MAQSQTIAFAETIRAMKLAMRRHAADPDSDSSIDAATNRGNKLKRNAQAVQLGRLDNTGGQSSYKRHVSHGGYTRAVISVNPQHYDDDGDAYSPTASDFEEGREGETLEEDPFGGVKLEELLRPLTSVAELPDHPGYRGAYESRALTELAEQAQQMLQRERVNLWKAKRLLQRLRGDSDWIPCGEFSGIHDEALLSGEGDDSGGNGARSVDGATTATANTTASLEQRLEPEAALGEAGHETTNQTQTDLRQTAGPTGVPIDGIEATDMAPAPRLNAEGQTSPHSDPVDGDLAGAIEGDRHATEETASTNTHAMTTRARARSPAERTPSPSPSESASNAPIHPWFLPSTFIIPTASNPAPSSAFIDRDLGLRPRDAEDTRRLLLLYTQKQELVIRNLETLYSGLARTDRLRHVVYRSCKAEAHLVPDGKGNMVTAESDGEDWYDLNDWGIKAWETPGALGRLEKGKDEDVEVGEEEGRIGRGRRRGVRRM